MTFLQNLWRDLVDKRLWPIVVVLLLGLIAVPFVIDSGASATSATAVAPVPAEIPAVGTAQIAVAVAPGGRAVKRPGSSRDPFKPLVYAKVPKTETTAATGVTGTAKTAAATSPSSGNSSAGTGSSTTGHTSPTTTTTPPATTPSSPTTTTKTKLFSYAISVAVKRAGRVTTRRGLRAITYLPSAVYPLVTFLGVKADDETATFLLSDGVGVLSGGSHCQPSATQCDLVELKAGENVLIARAPKLGEPVKRFRLILRHVALREVPPVKRSAAARKQATTRGAATSSPALPTDLAPSRQVTQSRTTG